jgi:hypothetical protein
MGTELRTSTHHSQLGAEDGGYRPEEEHHAGHLREQNVTDICS